MKDDQIYKDRRYRVNELREQNETLSSRERTIKAMNFEEPDRVPIDCWMVPEIKKRCLEYWGLDTEEELLDFDPVTQKSNGRSPNRVDASVYVLLELSGNQPTKWNA